MTQEGLNSHSEKPPRRFYARLDGNQQIIDIVEEGKVSDSDFVAPCSNTLNRYISEKIDKGTLEDRLPLDFGKLVLLRMDGKTTNLGKAGPLEVVMPEEFEVTGPANAQNSEAEPLSHEARIEHLRNSPINVQDLKRVARMSDYEFSRHISKFGIFPKEHTVELGKVEEEDGSVRDDYMKVDDYSEFHLTREDLLRESPELFWSSFLLDDAQEKSRRAYG